MDKYMIVLILLCIMIFISYAMIIYLVYYINRISIQTTYKIFRYIEERNKK